MDNRLVHFNLIKCSISSAVTVYIFQMVLLPQRASSSERWSNLPNHGNFDTKADVIDISMTGARALDRVYCQVINPLVVQAEWWSPMDQSCRRNLLRDSEYLPSRV